MGGEPAEGLEGAEGRTLLQLWRHGADCILASQVNFCWHICERSAGTHDRGLLHSCTPTTKVWVSQIHCIHFCYVWAFGNKLADN